MLYNTYINQKGNNFMTKRKVLGQVLEIEKMTDEEFEVVWDHDFQEFITGLEKLSKKTGICINGCGCYFWKAVGIKEVKYKRDNSSGDIQTEEVIFRDGTNKDDFFRN